MVSGSECRHSGRFRRRFFEAFCVVLCLPGIIARSPPGAARRAPSFLKAPMETVVVVMVLVSALMHASWNAFLHLSEDRVWLLGMMAVPYVLAGALGAAVLPLPAPASWPCIGASVVLECAYCVALIRAYRSGEVGQIYPIARGLSPLVVGAGALAFAGEALRPLAAAGVALVSAGIVSLAFKR